MAPGPVVSNASPLILLAGIGRLDVLQSLFVAVEISQEVRDEVTIRGAGRSGAA
jgi:predicted nucleic acid-binding protein